MKAMHTEIISAMQDYGFFDEETGELTCDDWVLEKTDNSWELYEEGYWSGNHCKITIAEKEVNKEVKK